MSRRCAASSRMSPSARPAAIEADNVEAYLSAGAKFVGMGGSLVNERHIEAGDQAAITAAAQRIL